MKVVLVLLLFYLVHQQEASKDKSFQISDLNHIFKNPVSQTMSKQVALVEQKKGIVLRQLKRQQGKKVNKKSMEKKIKRLKNRKHYIKNRNKMKARSYKRGSNKGSKKIRRIKKEKIEKGKKHKKSVTRKTNKRNPTKKQNKKENDRYISRKRGIKKTKQKIRKVIRNQILKGKIKKGRRLRNERKRKKSRVPKSRPIYLGTDLCSDGNRVQEFPCDMYGYTRDFSNALTQINIINRIMRKPKRMEQYVLENFQDSIQALEDVLDGARVLKSCKAANTRENNRIASLIYHNLIHCSTEVPTKCNVNITAPLYHDSNETRRAPVCKSRVEDFVKQYRESMFGKNVEGEQAKYSYVCPNLGSSWNADGTGQVQHMCDNNVTNQHLCDPTNYTMDGRIGFRMKSPNTPLEIWRDECLPKFTALNKELARAFDACKDSKLQGVGSWGSCMKFREESVYWIRKCNLDSSSIDIIRFYTTASVKFSALKTINAIIRLLYCYHTKLDIITCSNSNNESPIPISPSAVAFRIRRNQNSWVNRDFRDIIDAFNTSTADGTTCNGTNISEDGKNVYNILKNCTVSIPAICNPNVFFVKYKNLTDSKCYELMDEFVDLYQINFNRTAIGRNKKNSFDEDLKFANRTISGTNLTKILENIEKTNNSNSNSTKKLIELRDDILKNDCINKIIDLEPEIEEPLSNCKNETVVGSIGSCSAAIDTAINYITTCSNDNLNDFHNKVFNQFGLLESMSGDINELYCYQINPCSCSTTAMNTSSSTFMVMDDFSFQKRSTRSQPCYDEIVMNLNQTTEDGTTCNGTDIPDDAKKLYTILKNCSLSVPALCNPTPIKNKYRELHTNCFFIMQEFLTIYLYTPGLGTGAINSDTIINSNPTVQNQKFINSLISGADLTTIIETIETNDKRSSSNVDKLNNLMEKITEVDCITKINDVYSEVQKAMFKCKEETVIGSYDNCRNAIVSALTYITICGATTTPDEVTTTPTEVKTTPTNALTTMSKRRRRTYMKRI